MKPPQKTVQTVRVGGIMECSRGKGLFVPVSLICRILFHHFFSCSSSLTSPSAPLTTLVKAVWMQASGLCRNCFFHLEFLSPHLYLSNSTFSSRSSAITMLFCWSLDCDVLEVGLWVSYSVLCCHKLSVLWVQVR